MQGEIQRATDTLSYPESLPLTMPMVVEHMKADALARIYENGIDDVIAAWLWDLAEKVEADGVPQTPPGPVPKQRQPVD